MQPRDQYNLTKQKLEEQYQDYKVKVAAQFDIALDDAQYPEVDPLTSIEKITDKYCKDIKRMVRDLNLKQPQAVYQEEAKGAEPQDHEERKEVLVAEEVQQQIDIFTIMQHIDVEQDKMLQLQDGFFDLTRDLFRQQVYIMSGIEKKLETHKAQAPREGLKFEVGENPIINQRLQRAQVENDDLTSHLTSQNEKIEKAINKQLDLVKTNIKDKEKLFKDIVKDCTKKLHESSGQLFGVKPQDEQQYEICFKPAQNGNANDYNYQFPSVEQLEELQQDPDSLASIRLRCIRARPNQYSFNFVLNNGWKSDNDEKGYKLISFIFDDQDEDDKQCRLNNLCIYGQDQNGGFCYGFKALCALGEICNIGHLTGTHQTIPIAANERIIGFRAKLNHQKPIEGLYNFQLMTIKPKPQ